MTKWIDVNEKTPPLDLFLLVCDGAKVWIEYIFDRYGTRFVGLHGQPLSQITHWMHIPKLPKKKIG